MSRDCVGDDMVGAITTQQIKVLAQDRSADLRTVGELMQDLFGSRASYFSLPMRRQVITSSSPSRTLDHASKDNIDKPHAYGCNTKFPVQAGKALLPVHTDSFPSIFI